MNSKEVAIGTCLVSLAILVSSSRANAQTETIALDGNCPVLAAEGRWQLGKKELFVAIDGKIYRFSSSDAKSLFESEPFRFIPALGGDCVVCWKLNGKRVAGSSLVVVHHKSKRLPYSRIFLFPEKNEAYRKFLVDPTLYEAVDIANNGNCPITGKTGITAHYKLKDGFWTFFSSADAKSTYEKQFNIRK